MSALPVSVRLALWGTLALAGRVGAADVVQLAHPDVDAVAGDPAGRLELWRDLGEQVVLVALPHPGDLTGMPRCSPDVAGVAADAGECVYVAGIGGLLVPDQAEFGPVGDVGTRVDWQAYEAEPVPRHTLEMLSLSELERELAAAVGEASHDLERVHGRPWSSAPRDSADRRLAAGPWGLPADTSSRALRVMATAARVTTIADEGLVLAASGPALDLHSSRHREMGLRTLQGRADRTLAAAANLAVMDLAGWRPA